MWNDDEEHSNDEWHENVRIEALHQHAEAYQEQLAELRQKREQEKESLSLLLITSSFFSGISLYSTIRYGPSLEFPEVGILLISVVFGVIAVGAALGIARWALFDIISAKNAL